MLNCLPLQHPHYQVNLKVKKCLFFLSRFVCFVCITLIATATLWVTPAAIADDSTHPTSAPSLNAANADLANGSQVFQAHCEGCHINGGNIIRRGKTLKLNALQRNSMDSLEAITEIVTNGKNNMSAFHDRLTEQQITDVAAYVLNQAQSDWKPPKK